MSNKTTKVQSLLASIQRVAPAAAVAETAPAAVIESAPKAASVAEPSVAQRRAERRPKAPPVPAAVTKGKIGKPVQFWLHDEDRKLIRELAAWLSGQGIRSTDSMVLRAALRTAKTGGELLEAYRQASQLDGRLKQHKTA